jgi:spore germination cell wall hydrolase CwlJ-like protein
MKFVFIAFLLVGFSPVCRSGDYDVYSRDVICLAVNVHFEVGGEALISKIAVSQIVLERVADRRYSNDICQVVQKGKNVKGCAFTWQCDDKSNEIELKSKFQRDSWFEDVNVAKLMLSNNPPFISQLVGATLYYSTKVAPYTDPDIVPWWVKSDKVIFLAEIHGQRYYREE